MKRTIAAICGLALLIAGCREKNVPVVFPRPIVAGTDSTYNLLSVAGGVLPAPQPHNVLIEEFTGQGCSNCPFGHNTLDQLNSTAGYIGRMNVVSMYYYKVGFIEVIPPPGSTHDFRAVPDSITTRISDLIYGGIGSIPIAGLDRTAGGGSLLFEATQWANVIGTQESVADSLNMDVASSFSSNTATIKVTITYTRDVKTRQNISVFIVEDGIVDYQSYRGKPNDIDSSYVFKDVFRAALSHDYLGDGFLDTMAVKPAGQVYWRKFTYTIDTTKMNPANCRVIAFVNNRGDGGDYRVAQSVQCPLKP
jgi:hypothetical protein